MFDIDYVFTYVNNNEKVWQQSYKDYCIEHNCITMIDSINGSRYNDMGLLPFLVSGIKKNMPWIRKIHIVVSNKEQIPNDIANDEHVHIVVHSDIIPAQYLPTFNSQTI